MKILIITYYWPPAGGSGVQRWLKFVKYFKDFGIEPIVYTVKDASYIKEDASLIKEIPDNTTVLKQRIWQPEQLLFWKKKQTNTKQVATLTKNSYLSFIRGNFFIPDPKVFWVNRSVSFLSKYLSENNIEAIVSTGPPHSMHLIAMKLKNKTGLPWLADFRDPWTNLYYNKDFNQSFVSKKINAWLEKKVLQKANIVTTVSSSLQQEFNDFSKNVKVITNGFDNEVSLKKSVHLDKKFSISYVGLLPKQSHSDLFFKVLKKLIIHNEGIKNNLVVNIVGDIATEVKLSVKKYGIEKYVNFKGYVNHYEAIEVQQRSQVLLLLIPNVTHNKGILTGKLFEYITSKRPILAIGPKGGDLEEILTTTQTGEVINYTDEEKMTEVIITLYNKYNLNNLVVKPKAIQQYHRRTLTNKMAKYLKELKK